MKIDLTSWAFGFAIQNSAGNPNWAVALGQGGAYKINQTPSLNEFLKGMIYRSVPLSCVQTKMGKGGALYRGDDPSAAFVTASVFDKIYVNEAPVPNCRYLLLLTRDTSKSHAGRLRLKFSPHNEFIPQGETSFKNADENAKIRNALGLSATACWFVFALRIVNQDELHLYIGVADKGNTVSYTSTEALHLAWEDIIAQSPFSEFFKDEEDPASTTTKPHSSPAENPTPPTMLNLALRRFQEVRDQPRAGDKPSYDHYNQLARQFFCDVDGDKLKSCDWKQFRVDHFNGSAAAAHFYDYTDTDKDALGSWLKSVREAPQDIAEELKRMPELKGLGKGGMIPCMFMMKARPDLFCAYSGQEHDSLKTLGLENASTLLPFTIDNYNHYRELQSKIVSAMADMGIKQADGTTPADFLTVNEFLWFVSEQYDLIMKEWSKHMKKEIKLGNQSPIDLSKFEDFIKAFHKAAEDAGLTYDLALVKRFVCALLAKPFVVLTGLSGSGKTKLAQAFTQWIAVSETARIVPVGADWANNEKLLGYPNGLDPNNYVLPDTGVLKLMIDANDNPTVPFFLILDEMNLSHVERYFADFLSAMESNGSIKLYDGKNRTADDGTPVPPTIPFPKNLFVIGTMNVDETTHMFSPKVLDRAQVIEFRVTAEQMADYLDKPMKLDMTQVDGKGLQFAQAFLDLHNTPAELEGNDKKTVADALKQFFPTLAELGSEFAFRTASEAKLFCAFARKANLSVEESVDAAIMQKLLPKLHGSRRRLALPLEAFWEFCRMDGKTESLGDICKKDATVKVADVAKYKVSAEKIKRLYKAAETNGFASYAEA